VGSAGAGWARLCLARGRPGLSSPHDGRPLPVPGHGHTAQSDFVGTGAGSRALRR